MRLGRGLNVVLFVICVFLIPIFFQSSNYYLIILILCGINIILTSSLRLIASVGQMSMSTMAFAGIGAYTSAILMMKLGFPIWAAFPFVRVTGIYFAMLTLFFGEVVRLVISEWSSMTGGTTGLFGIPSIGALSFFGLNIDFAHLLPYCYFVLVVMLLTLLILYRIDCSHLGTTLAAIERDENVSASVGINVIKYKVMTFCIGCFFAGLAGSLYAHHLRLLNAETFGLFPSIYVLIYMVAGGRKKFSGPILGALILTVIPEVFRVLKQYQPLIFVGVLFLVLFFIRGGLVDLPGKIKSRLRTGREGRPSNA